MNLFTLLSPSKESNPTMADQSSPSATSDPKKISQQTSPKHDDPTYYCINECLFNRTGESKTNKMLRCCVCMEWFHFKCVNEDHKTTRIWSCYVCRKIPQLLQQLCDQMCTIRSCMRPNNQNNQNLDFVDVVKDIQSKMNILIADQKVLQAANIDLTTRLAEVSKEKDNLQKKLDNTEKNMTQITSPQNENRSLLIGNSLLRNISSTDTSKLEVKCRSGSTYDSLTEELAKTDQKYKNIIIVSGTTDCRNMEKTTAVIQESSRKLLTEARKHSKHVTYSSILPQIDPENTGINLKTDNVNDYLKQMCNESTNCTFIDNDCSFKLSNTNPNDALYVNDGVHVNFKGAQKLLSNLKLFENVSVKRPPRKFQQVYSYGNSTDHTPGRDGRSATNPHGYQTRYRCPWCKEQDHHPEDCPRRRSRACFNCKSPLHMARDCPWLGCPWSG